MALSILFVDDDIQLLDGIRRLLYVERNDITTAFAHSAEEALRILENKKFDVIVSDHLMEGFSGLTLLSIVRFKYPESRRVMLSAQVLEDIHDEAEKLADKYISKPCDTMKIISEIEKLFVE